ncbi:MAG TPA: YihY/virulence factor BrkB family protein [Cytophagaceae bacterium]|jgi:membrane protein
MIRVNKNLSRPKAYNHLVQKLNARTLTTHDIPLLLLVKIFRKQIAKDNIVERAQAMAFNFTLSIFPAIIFLFTLIPYIPIPKLDMTIMNFLSQIMPRSIFFAASSTINDIIKIPRGGLLSFGFLVTVGTLTNGVMAMMEAFNRCYKTKDSRGIFKKIGIAIGLIFVLFLVMVVTVGITLLVKFYLEWLEQSIPFNLPFIYYFLVPLKYFILSIVFYIAISIIYFIAPAVKVRWGFLSYGNYAATVLCVLFNALFSFYINSFEAYNKVYGSIGAIIGIMLWFFIISLILLIGFEINASIDVAKAPAGLALERKLEVKKK